MRNEITLGKYRVLESAEPYIIAEIGVNHGGSMDLAKRLIELAKEGGAHAAKFQTYKAHTLASKHSPAYWDLNKEKTTSQYELFKKYDSFGPAEYHALAEHCRRMEIDFLSTPFDDAAVDFLDPLVPFFKIASADLTNIPFLRKIARKGKPVVLSTGASRLGEVDIALRTLAAAGCREVALLHCVLNYPTPDPNAHVSMIAGLRNAYPELVIGYSDHTLPDPAMVTLTTAYLKGARIIEKHFTHDKTLPGNDHYHAMTAEDLRNYFTHLRKIRALEGNEEKAPIPSEEISRENARRSIVLSRSVRAGAVLREEDLTYKRPGTGVSPLHWDAVIGMKAARDLEEDHVLRWEDLESGSPGKVVAIVQARMSSQRFPGKMLARLDGRPMLEWVLQRVKRATRVQEVVMATSENPEDDGLEKLARSLGIRVFRGSESDVLSRFAGAARASEADLIVRVCADNPFVDPTEIDRLVDHALHTRAEYSFNHIPALSNRYADGFGGEAVWRRILEEMDRWARRPDQREHVTRYLWDHRHAFKLSAVPAPTELAHEKLRFDVDTPADLARLESLAKEVGIEGSAAQFVQAELKRR